MKRERANDANLAHLALLHQQQRADEASAAFAALSVGRGGASSYRSSLAYASYPRSASLSGGLAADLGAAATMGVPAAVPGVCFDSVVGPGSKRRREPDEDSESPLQLLGAAKRQHLLPPEGLCAAAAAAGVPLTGAQLVLDAAAAACMRRAAERILLPPTVHAACSLAIVPYVQRGPARAGSPDSDESDEASAGGGDVMQLE